MGALTGLNTIITNNLNPKISSFFFCTLLFYLFFEVFFSFFRKLTQKKSPIYPDDKHLHMLSFYKISSIYGKNKGNYLNSIMINIVYSVLVVPALLFAKDPLISRYWFFFLLSLYIYMYIKLYNSFQNYFPNLFCLFANHNLSLHLFWFYEPLISLEERGCGFQGRR